MKNGLNEMIHIPVGEKELTGDLVIPENCQGLVLFSHGSGSSRLSPRNIHVAKILQQRGIATLLFDLLTPEEDSEYQTRFNIPLLTDRLVGATKYIVEFEWMRNFRVGYFGASTGAASALKAAAELPDVVKAVVSRGGRPDLAGDSLLYVKAPTLLIIGQLDHQVIELNESAYKKLNCTKQIEIVPGATHLFEEPGTLDEAARLAVNWFSNYLQPLKIPSETGVNK